MPRSRRSAFSLIELIVVIALIAVLVALSAGAYMRVRSAQIVNATEATLNKLNSGMDRVWSATRDQADKEFSTKQLIGNASMDSLMAFAGSNEKERARAIWLYFRMKNEFPQTFAEAVSYTTLTSPTGTVFSLPPKQTFLTSITGSPTVPSATVIASLAPTSANDANYQAAALLYLILAEKGSRGEVFDTDVLKAHIVEVPISGKNFRVFMDSWNTPISYIRFLTNAEVDSAPYSRNDTSLFNLPTSLPAGVSNNPFDVTARLTATGWTNFASFCSSAGIVTSASGTSFQEQLLRRNFMVTVVSAGPDKTFIVLNPKPPPPIDVLATLDPTYLAAAPYTNIGIVQHGVGGGSVGDDNIYGYRLRKFGARSD